MASGLGQATRNLQTFGRAAEAAGRELAGLARAAGPVEGIRAAFEGLASSSGKSADELLAALERGSAGMVSQRDLMQTYNRAAQLVSVTFANELPDAMGYLSKVSAATGEDMSYMLNSLVVGVGRLSPMILDNLGVQVSLSEATALAAQMYGVEAEALTKAQLQAGMMSVVLEKLRVNTAEIPDVTAVAAAGIGQFDAELQNAKDNIGTAVLPVLSEAFGVFNEMGDGAQMASVGFVLVGGAALKAAGGLGGLATALGTTQLALGAVGVAVAAVIVAFNEFKKVQATITDGEEAVNEALGEFSVRAARMTEDGSALNEVAESLADSINGMGQAMDDGGIITDLFIDRQGILTNAATEAEAAIRAQAGSYEEYRAAVDTMNVALTATAATTQVVTDELGNQIFVTQGATQQIQAMSQAEWNAIEAAQMAAAVNYERREAMEAARVATQGLAEAQAAAADTAAAQAGTTMSLAESLMKATDQQIASRLIGMLDPQKMGADAYGKAVAEIGTSFGVMDERSIALASTMGELALAIEAGVIPAEDADQALQTLIADASDGDVEMGRLLDTFGRAPGTIRPVGTALRDAGGGMASISANSRNAIEGIEGIGSQAYSSAPLVDGFARNLRTTQSSLETLVAGSPWRLSVEASSGGGSSGGGTSGGGGRGGGVQQQVTVNMSAAVAGGVDVDDLAWRVSEVIGQRLKSQLAVM
jgi:hypothetical protein